MLPLQLILFSLIATFPNAFDTGSVKGIRRMKSLLIKTVCCGCKIVSYNANIIGLSQSKFCPLLLPFPVWLCLRRVCMHFHFSIVIQRMRIDSISHILCELNRFVFFSRFRWLYLDVWYVVFSFNVSPSLTATIVVVVTSYHDITRSPQPHSHEFFQFGLVSSVAHRVIVMGTV